MSETRMQERYPGYKVCRKCNQEKPLEEFGFRAKNADKRSNKCKECVRNDTQAWREADPERYRLSKQASQQATAAVNKAWIRDYLQSHPCVDCDESDWVVLEFDHLGDKTEALGRMIHRLSLKRIKEEVMKCNVVCANCHRRRTYNRAGSWRVSEIV